MRFSGSTILLKIKRPAVGLLYLKDIQFMGAYKFRKRKYKQITLLNNVYN
jgi:hypothetical protein